MHHINQIKNKPKNTKNMTKLEVMLMPIVKIRQESKDRLAKYLSSKELADMFCSTIEVQMHNDLVKAVEAYEEKKAKQQQQNQ